MRDIAERKQHARKLFETIIQTEEEERSRFARDIHDDIGPLISALKIFTTSFLETSDTERKDKLAQQIGSIIREVIDSVKTISNDLSPHVLLNFGLHAAICNFIELFSKNVDITLSSNLGTMRFQATEESLIYRIIKELINNTVKHARATNIKIDIDYYEPALICHYRDNGMGFDWEHQISSMPKGLGINNIIARIRSLGGEYEVVSKPEHGFEINIVLQMKPQNAIDKQKI
jgi:signal transduction histidine kinase